MSADFNPGKYEQPDFAKQQVDSARSGLSLFLIFVFTVGRSVQLFSRKAGTAGPFMMLGNLLCIVVQAFYYQGCVERSGSHDFVGIEFAFAIQFAWFAYGIIATFRYRHRGLEVGPKEMGLGVLHRLMPNSETRTIGVSSDLIVAVLLACVFFVFDSPILGGWYCRMVVWLIFGHSWISFREQRELQRIKFATARAKHLSNRFRRRI